MLPDIFPDGVFLREFKNGKEQWLDKGVFGYDLVVPYFEKAAALYKRYALVIERVLGVIRAKVPGDVSTDLRTLQNLTKIPLTLVVEIDSGGRYQIRGFNHFFEGHRIRRGSILFSITKDLRKDLGLMELEELEGVPLA